MAVRYFWSLLVALGLVALVMPSRAAAARCPRDCRLLFKEQAKTCKAACLPRKPGKSCRAACVATRKSNQKTCKASVEPTPPLCGLPPVTTTITTSTIATTSSSVVPSTTSTTVAPTNCAVEPDGRPCDLDANLCTNDQCANGSCQLVGTTVCLSPAPCYTSVACEPAIGGCTSGGYVGDGELCGGLASPAGICAAGTCHVGKDCLIAGVPYAAGDPHPEFDCLACQCRVVALDPPATGGGSCAAPDYNTIQAAVDAASADETIVICPGTYNLTATVTVPVDLSFIGSGQANTIIDGANGGNGVQLFNGGGATGGVDGGRHVTFRGLTFRNGLDRELASLAAGGAIAATTVEVSDSTFTGNTAHVATEGGPESGLDVAFGGAIAAKDAVVRGCTFDGNVVQGEYAEIIGGGAIFAETVDVADSTFTNNRVVDNIEVLVAYGTGGGGAIYGTDVDVRDSTFSNNAATTRWWNDGGAIAAFSQVSVVRSTFVDNAASGSGGAIYATGDVSVVESALLRNSAFLNGGAVALFASPPPTPGYRGTVMADKTTFDENVSRGGGAIAGYGVVLTNSTLTNNVASGDPPFPNNPRSETCDGWTCEPFPSLKWCCHFGDGGGGAVAAVDSVTATNCTFAGNVGVTGTIHRGPNNYSQAGTSTLTNAILVGSLGGGMCSSNGTTSRIDGGGNFSVDASCEFTHPSSQANVSADALGLWPLADNGGPTETVALFPDSIANGAGTCALATDQRGRPRPGPGAPGCESGAYELQAGAGTSCLVDEDCDSNVCDGVCKCPRSRLYTFGTNEQPGSVWPGGTSTQSASPGCSVTVQNPDADVSLTCGSGLPFSVLDVAGYSSCTGSGGEDGDGCQLTSCPLGEGSCCDGRPSCLGNPPGTATATYSVQCLP